MCACPFIPRPMALTCLLRKASFHEVVGSYGSMFLQDASVRLGIPASLSLQYAGSSAGRLYLLLSRLREGVPTDRDGASDLPVAARAAAANTKSMQLMEATSLISRAGLVSPVIRCTTPPH